MTLFSSSRLSFVASGLTALSLFLGLAAPARAEPPPAPTGKHWEMAWGDEFEGTEVDTTKWSFWHDGEVRRAATNLAENSFLSDGNLNVQIVMKGAQLTAGGLQSKMGFGYGYYEVRQQVHGGWATFWMQSPGIAPGDPATTGTEMDIAEACCPGRVAHAVHWGGYEAEHLYVVQQIPTETMPDQEEWNTFGLEWSEGVYKFWVNGVLNWTFTQAVSSRDDEWIRLTQETDGDYCGGQCLYMVDYIRAYHLVDGEGGSSGAGGAGGSPGTGGNAAGAGAGGTATGGSGGSGGNLAAAGAATSSGAGGTAAGAGGGSAAMVSDEETDSGCGCRSARSSHPAFAGFGSGSLAALGVLALGRRLKRRRR